VWALNSRFFDWLITSRFEAPDDWQKRLTLVTAPYATNPNLAAQAGVFTLDRSATSGEGLEDVIKPMVEHLLARTPRPPFTPNPRADPRIPVIYKFTLPHTQATRLLKSLAYDGVTAGTLFPGLAGVVDAMKEREIWRWEGVREGPLDPDRGKLFHRYARAPGAVTETFVSVSVADMRRATDFLKAALGATSSFSSPNWSSLHVAGTRIGLALVPGHAGGPTGLHFAVPDLDEAQAAVERAGGQLVEHPVEVAPGVIVSKVEDTEGNTFALTQR
jgi:predicted enzyme related to lactoylglutathione lyase